jgi:ketosteroid isomerase-like protein
MNRRITVVGILLALSFSCLAADDASGIRSAEKAWSVAVEKGDTAALNRIYADRLIYAHATGIIQTKREIVDQIASGARNYKEFSPESMRIEPYTDAAVAHYKAHSVGSVDGKPFDDHVMVLHLWVKEGGRWRLAAHQTTKIQ